MEKGTQLLYLHLQEDGQYVNIQLPFTIPPNVGDSISYLNEQGEVYFLIVTKRTFSYVTNNLIINLKTN